MTTIYVRDNAVLPKRRDFDFYPTPYYVAEDALSFLPDDLQPARILDPGAGTGIWGNAARKRYQDAIITGVETRIETAKPVAYDVWIHDDFLLTQPSFPYNLVIGNPPYDRAEQFIRHSMRYLDNGGYIIMLLRLNFLEGQGRAKGLYREYPLKQVVVRAARVSFTGDGQTNATAYAYFIWQKGYKGETTLKITTGE